MMNDKDLERKMKEQQIKKRMKANRESGEDESPHPQKRTFYSGKGTFYSGSQIREPA